MGKSIIRVNVSKGKYDTWDDTVYVSYNKKTDNVSRILENDIIDLYGQLNVIMTYKSVLGNEISIPYLQDEYISIN